MAIMHKQTLEGNELVCFRHKFQSKGENQYIYIYIYIRNILSISLSSLQNNSLVKFTKQY